MAQCLQSVHEFLQDAFVPAVAALCSEEAERLTRKNNLTFCELVRPFCRLTSEVHMRDPNNQLHVIKNLKIAVHNIVTQSPQPGAIRKLLNDVVSTSQPADGLVANVITAGDYDLNISDRSLKASVPWYSNWKDTLMELNTSKFYSVERCCQITFMTDRSIQKCFCLKWKVPLPTRHLHPSPLMLISAYFECFLLIKPGETLCIEKGNTLLQPNTSKQPLVGGYLKESRLIKTLQIGASPDRKC